MRTEEYRLHIRRQWERVLNIPVLTNKGQRSTLTIWLKLKSIDVIVLGKSTKILWLTTGILTRRLWDRLIVCSAWLALKKCWSASVMRLWDISMWTNPASRHANWVVFRKPAITLFDRSRLAIFGYCAQIFVGKTIRGPLVPAVADLRRIPLTLLCNIEFPSVGNAVRGTVGSQAMSRLVPFVSVQLHVDDGHRLVWADTRV